MNEAEIKYIKKIARIFEQNHGKILQNWLLAVKDENLVQDEQELAFFKKSFVHLLEAFVARLKTADLDGYFDDNARIAAEIAFNDVSYQKFIHIFHLFESSYGVILEKALGEAQLLDYLGALDRLHHESIAIVSEEYFKVKDSTVFALAKLAEMRDPLTGHHLERTRDYSVLLAKHFSLGKDFSDQIFRVGPLHDIGKVAVADRILLKEGPLTAEEFDAMKEHTTIGSQTIKSIIGNQVVSRGYLNMAWEIALYHHEKMDGSGYPQGLKGDEIPMAARIFALADAYDAIASPRSYKKAFPHEEAVRRIAQSRGTHFDPRVVDVFLQLQDEFKRIHDSYD